jgi:hypothetical protein
MNRNKVLVFVVLTAALALSSCSGHPGGSSGSGGSTGSLSLTLISDTLPLHPSIVAYKVVITGITLNSSSGNHGLTLASALTVDLMHLQSDSAFLGTFGNVPVSQYTGVTLAISSATVTFFNDTGLAITNTGTPCANLSFCTATGAAAVPAVTFIFSVPSNGFTGLSVDIHLANTVSLTGTSFVTLNAANVASAFTLPRPGGNFSATQFDLIEDFTGVVTLNGNVATIKSPTRGTLTATATTSTIFDTDPSLTFCTNPVNGSLSSCVSNNQVVSADAILNSNGTLTLQEIEPLFATPEDIVEGVVNFLPPTNPAQFGIVVTDVPSTATTNSLIGTSLGIGDQLTLNLFNVLPFEVDSKGLPVSTSFPAIFSDFFGHTSAGAIHFGQRVAVHITPPFTVASGTSFAAANTDFVVLRMSRLIALATTQGTTSILNVNTLPSYFGFSPATSFVVQLFPGTPGTRGVTNFDGITTGAGVTASQPVAIRALFFEDPANSAVPAFFAAKVRFP